MDPKKDVYLEFEFTISPLEPAREILVAELGELGFESFVEHEHGLSAYVLKETLGNTSINGLFILQNPDFQITFTSKEIVQQNWNAEWERNFKPIRVGESCMVRAPFHSKENVAFDIIIEPKMSFGTGHHETTHMMLEHILGHEFNDKTVLDMGCGTGVLGILAAMKGAKAVDAVDIDEWCVVNSLENVERNNCSNVSVFQGDVQFLNSNKGYDVILANINRNILLEDIPVYGRALKPGGLLFLSGFYLGDLPAINSKCAENGLEFDKNLEKNAWVSSKYVNSVGKH